MFTKRFIPGQQVIPGYRLSLVISTGSPTSICKHRNTVRLLLSLSVNSRTILILRFRNIIQVYICLEFYIEGQIQTCKIVGCQHATFFIIEIIIVGIIPIVTRISQTMDSKEIH